MSTAIPFLSLGLNLQFNRASRALSSRRLSSLRMTRTLSPSTTPSLRRIANKITTPSLFSLTTSGAYLGSTLTLADGAVNGPGTVEEDAGLGAKSSANRKIQLPRLLVKFGALIAAV